MKLRVNLIIMSIILKDFLVAYLIALSHLSIIDGCKIQNLLYIHNMNTTND